MKSVLRALAFASLLFSLPVLSADKSADKSADQSADQSADLAEGTVKKIDVAGQRVMLAHGPIANLGMPPMTMMFKLKDAAMLKKLKDGDKVRFRVEDVGGEYTIVRIDPAR